MALLNRMDKFVVAFQEGMEDIKEKCELDEAQFRHVCDKIGQKKAIIFLKDAIEGSHFEDATAVQVALVHALDKVMGEKKISFQTT